MFDWMIHSYFKYIIIYLQIVSLVNNLVKERILPRHMNLHTLNKKGNSKGRKASEQQKGISTAEGQLKSQKGNSRAEGHFPT